MSDRRWSLWLYPKRTGDVGRDRNARTLQFACLLFALTIGMIVTLDTITGETAVLPLPGMAVVGLLVAAAINLTGKSTWAAQAAVLSIMLTAILLVLEARDGFRSHAMLVFPGLLLLSVMLLDRASYLAIAGIVLMAVASLGIAERYGLTRAVPGVRSPTSYESIFNVDVILLVYAAIGSRIALDAQRNVLDLRAGIDQLSATNLELRRAEEALRQKTRSFLTVANCVPDLIWSMDLSGHFTYLSPAVERTHRRTVEEALKIQQWGTVTPEQAAKDDLLLKEELEKAASPQYDRNRVVTFESEQLRKDGATFWAEVSASLLWSDDGKPIGVTGITRDITERKQAEDALRVSEARFRALAESALVGIYVIQDGKYTYVNPAMAHAFGYTVEELTGMTPYDLAHRSDHAIIDENLRRRISREVRSMHYEFRGRYKDGSVREVEVYGTTVEVKGRPAVVGTLVDVTERKRTEQEKERLQRELAHAQKMESVGRLAGGVAHDFNNLLSVILMHADSAIEGLTEGQALGSIKEIQWAAEKGVALGRQLMAFSSKQVLHVEILSLNDVIADSQRMVRRLIGEDVKVVFESHSGSCNVKADRGQLGQILMNLAVNSRDAMPEGGTFTIETATVDLDESIAPVSSDAKPGAYVMLVVRDTGIGMGPEMQARIFEPFFTTKDPGKGTGLGLSVVYGAVKQSGGFITVTSEPGHGTEFRIYLPAVVGTSEPVVDTDKWSIQGGSETILLVEDEPTLRDKIHELLESAGYQVLAAADGEQAYRLALRETRPIHLLLTDVVMPEMSGSRLSERMRNLRPETKTLFMSGYPDNGDAGIDLRSLPNFTQKPFTKERLLCRVREVLDGNNIPGVAT